jgi:hypothetical protein
MKGAVGNGAFLWILVVEERIPVFETFLWTNKLKNLPIF